MKIVNANQLDLNMIATQKYKLFDSAWRGILPDSWLNGFTIESVLQSIKEQLHKGNAIYLAFDGNSEPCGLIIYGKYRNDNNIKHGEIISIYFYEKYKGYGYAQKLFNFAENELIKNGYNKIFIWVLEINSRARRFYEKNGYTNTGKTRFQNCDELYNEMLYAKNV